MYGVVTLLNVAQGQWNTCFKEASGKEHLIVFFNPLFEDMLTATLSPYCTTLAIFVALVCMVEIFPSVPYLMESGTYSNHLATCWKRAHAI